MSLVKTSAEIKANFSSADKDYNIASLQSFIDDAERDIVVPWIGQAFYDDIQASYISTCAPIAGVKKSVLQYLQAAIVHLAFLKASDSGSLRVSDTGFYVVSTNTSRPVSDKKMVEFRRSRRETGYKALEQATIFLEANINDADLVIYKNSDQRIQHRAFFINDSVDFTRYYKKVNNSAYLFWQIQDSLDFAERTYIRPVLGAAYFDQLKGKILGNNFSDTEKLLLPFIKRALANYTMVAAVPDLAVEFDGPNLIIRSEPSTGHFDAAETKAGVSSEQLSVLLQAAKYTSKVELSNLEDYLIANAAVLQGYTPPEDTEDVNINSPDSPTFFV